MKPPRRAAGILLIACALAAGRATAHEGPPYAIFVDRTLGPYRLSLWGDPDVGTGMFFVIFDPEAHRSASDPRVAIEVRPASGRLAPASHSAHRLPDRTYRASVPFDREETWIVRLTVSGSRGAGTTEVEVSVTPPGYGRWDLAVYVFPFLLLGGMWALVALRRRQVTTEG